LISDSYQYTSLDGHKIQIEIPTPANQHGAPSPTVSSGRRKNLFPIKTDFWGKKNEWISEKKKQIYRAAAGPGDEEKQQTTMHAGSRFLAVGS
jgi:hypothetical protein